MSWIDLHLHSHYSTGGQFSPTELMYNCKRLGIKVASITDRNTTAGIDEAINVAKEIGIQLIPGIEIDCVYNDIELHIIGYWIDHQSTNLNKHINENHISISETIQAIKDANGIAILAHPGKSIKQDEKLLEHVLAFGFSGIEVYSSYHSAEQTQLYKQKAASHYMAATCGSDFHRETKQTIKIGSVECEGLEKQILINLGMFKPC